MAKKLVIPGSVYSALQKQRISSVSSKLTPEQRAAGDINGYRSSYQADLVSEAELKRELAVAPDGSRPRDLLEAQMGKGMSGADVKRRISRLNPALVWETSRAYPDRWLIRRKEEGGELATICAMPKGFMPEFSVLNLNESKHFNKETGGIEVRREIAQSNPETRGWRTVLVKLIKAGAITEPGAARMFGLPTVDSKRWKEHIS